MGPNPLELLCQYALEGNEIEFHRLYSDLPRNVINEQNYRGTLSPPP